MISWLSDWLKQVILIILLASFVDLLLPNHAMQRYVRTVVSLFLLLTLLTPVFELFQRGWDADQLIAEATAKTGGSRTEANGGGALQSLQSVLADSEKLKADNARDARQLAEAQLAEEMKAGLKQATGASIDELEVSIDDDAEGNPVIGSVRAVLSFKQEEAEPSAKADGASVMDPVQVEKVRPVVIAIQPGAAGAAEKQEETAAYSGLQEEQKGQAVRFFREEWQVPPERLDIRIAS